MEFQKFNYKKATIIKENGNVLGCTIRQQCLSRAMLWVCKHLANASLSVQRLCPKIAGDLWLPTITILHKLLLVVQQLLQ
jgi:hypothetical protein